MDFDHNDHQRLEEIVQKTRWDEVADARQRVLDRLETIDELDIGRRSGLSEESVSKLLQRAVQLYIQQVETILDPINAPTTDWWTEKWIGTFDLPNGEAVEIVGIAEYLDLDEQLAVTVEREHQSHGARMPETKELEVSMTPPPGVHRNAFRATNRALADQGIEFDTRDRDVDESDLTPDSAL